MESVLPLSHLFDELPILVDFGILKELKVAKLWQEEDQIIFLLLR